MLTLKRSTQPTQRLVRARVESEEKDLKALTLGNNRRQIDSRHPPYMFTVVKITGVFNEIKYDK
jgi:hypothetical protein